MREKKNENQGIVGVKNFKTGEGAGSVYRAKWPVLRERRKEKGRAAVCESW